MATYTVHEVALNTVGTVTEAGDREYSRYFVVEVSAAVSALDVLQGGQVASPPLPRYGQVMVTEGGTPDGSAICIGLEVRQRAESVYLWDVTARYSSARVSAIAPTATAGSGGGGAVPAASGGSPANPETPQEGGAAGGSSSTTTPTIVENPLSRPAKFSWSSTKIQKPLIKDKDGNAIVNSAGQPFDPPLMTEEVHAILTVNKNMPITTVTSSYIQTYVNAINSAIWEGFPAQTVKCNDITASAENENGVWFWATTYTFEYNKRGWNPVEVLDQGWNELNALANDWVPVLDDYGKPYSKPSLLDGTGYALAEGDPLEFLSFNVYSEVAFSGLGLF